MVGTGKVVHHRQSAGAAQDKAEVPLRIERPVLHHLCNVHFVPNLDRGDCSHRHWIRIAVGVGVVDSWCAPRVARGCLVPVGLRVRPRPTHTIDPQIKGAVRFAIVGVQTQCRPVDRRIARYTAQIKVQQA